MSEEMIVDFASPTLAGIKSGSLFSGECSEKRELSEYATAMNRQLKPHGLRLMPLRYGGKRALIYVFSPEKLAADLGDPLAVEILTELGYPVASLNRCVVRLAERVREGSDFPHEIGLFLGYPSEDVKGFISGGVPKCTGFWRVYSDVRSAEKKFAELRECTRRMRESYKEHRSMDKLITSCS